jgi:hypothetical protein
MAILKVKDAQGVWKDIPQINGPTGPTGPTGPSVTGPTGPTGASDSYYLIANVSGATIPVPMEHEVDPTPTEGHTFYLVSSGGVMAALDDMWNAIGEIRTALDNAGITGPWA